MPHRVLRGVKLELDRLVNARVFGHHHQPRVVLQQVQHQQRLAGSAVRQHGRLLPARHREREHGRGQQLRVHGHRGHAHGRFRVHRERELARRVGPQVPEAERQREVAGGVVVLLERERRVRAFSVQDALRVRHLGCQKQTRES
jgi:hypothetical protein